MYFINKYIDDFLNFKSNYSNILHDHILPLIVSQSGKVIYLDEATIKYRQHEKNQVGTKRYVDRFKTFDEVRNHLLDVKLNLFNTYIDNTNIFNKEQNN